MMSESLTLWNNVCVLSRGDRINILAETHRTATRRRPEPNENRAQQVSHRQEPEEVFQFLLQFLILGQYQTSKVIYELRCLNSCHVFKLIINVSANLQTAAKKQNHSSDLKPNFYTVRFHLNVFLLIFCAGSQRVWSAVSLYVTNTDVIQRRPDETQLTPSPWCLR